MRWQEGPTKWLVALLLQHEAVVVDRGGRQGLVLGPWLCGEREREREIGIKRDNSIVASRVVRELKMTCMMEEGSEI